MAKYHGEGYKSNMKPVIKRKFLKEDTEFRREN